MHTIYTCIQVIYVGRNYHFSFSTYLTFRITTTPIIICGMENRHRYIIFDALVFFENAVFSFGGCLRDLNATDRIWEGLKIIF